MKTMLITGASSGFGRGIAIACGVAAAISTAFNAPIAGLVFAHEVILRHYSMRAFAPVAVIPTPIAPSHTSGVHCPASGTSAAETAAAADSSGSAEVTTGSEEVPIRCAARFGLRQIKPEHGGFFRFHGHHPKLRLQFLQHFAGAGPEQGSRHDDRDEHDADADAHYLFEQVVTADEDETKSNEAR